MQAFFIFSALITLAAIFSFINVKVFKLPHGISLMLMGTIVSVLLLIIGNLSIPFTQSIRQELSLINFSEILLGIFLSFLLFAGSLRVKYSDLIKSAKSILSFAVIGTFLSTFLTGTLVFFLLPLFHFNIPFIQCILFGALISPTDPVAVLGILSKTNLSDSIEVKITGESLFNDGIGVVIFTTILEISTTGISNTTFTSVFLLFIREAVGGLIAGFVIGYIGYMMMKTIDHFQTEVLITLAMVMGGYSLCHFIHVSGPLAMVVAGIFTGNKIKREAMSESTRDYVKKFWEVMDEVLNALLFMLMGLELVLVGFRFIYFVIGMSVAVLLLIARYGSLWLPASIFNFRKSLENKAIEIMTWGGLRGGISIALVLSLPDNSYKDIFVAVTFTIVLFSILVQGFTMNRFIKFITSS